MSLPIYSFGQEAWDRDNAQVLSLGQLPDSPPPTGYGYGYTIRVQQWQNAN